MSELADARAPMFIPSDIRGKTGLWFIKNDSGTLDTLPLASGNYGWSDLFLPFSAQPVAADLGGPALEQIESVLFFRGIKPYQTRPSPMMTAC